VISLKERLNSLIGELECLNENSNSVLTNLEKTLSALVKLKHM